jgi:hypothetical protein
MSAECGCMPGTSENGWHETTSPACREVELEQWRHAMALADEFLADLRAERGA